VDDLVVNICTLVSVNPYFISTLRLFRLPVDYIQCPLLLLIGQLNALQDAGRMAIVDAI